MYKYMISDLFRYYGKTDAITFIKAILVNRTFRFQCVLRMCQSKSVLKYLGYFLWMCNRSRKSIMLPRKTKIGYGLYIGHNGPVVINPAIVIGNNVNLSQFTTIGSNHNKAAIIGDNVTIGAGSVVTKCIPDNATAVGNYAKVINYNNPERYIHNRWTDV